MTLQMVLTLMLGLLPTTAALATAAQATTAQATATLAAAALPTAAQPAATRTHAPPADRVVLENGVVIEAHAVVVSDATVEIDLGFQVLTVPRSAITRLEEGAQGVAQEVDADADGDADSSADAESNGRRLYRHAAGHANRALDDNIAAVGEAVVLVRTPVGLGSGFVIHPEGYLITNDHVVEGTTELTVVVYRKATDGLRKDEYKHIRIVATSELLDLALLKIEPDEEELFETVALSDSNELVQGEAVFAVGNPMGLERSLSEGIVALKSRLLSGQTYVQTTAALSPGNSGGPLFNMAGEVIGVNSLKIAAQGAEGLSFSIPVNQVKAFIDSQEAYAFDTLNANSGHRYYAPPQPGETQGENP